MVVPLSYVYVYVHCLLCVCVEFVSASVCFLFVPWSIVDLWIGMEWRWLLLVGGRGWLVLGFAACACACVFVFVCCVVLCHVVCRVSLLVILIFRSSLVVSCRLSFVVRRPYAVLLDGCLRAACWPRHAVAVCELS